MVIGVVNVNAYITFRQKVGIHSYTYMYPTTLHTLFRTVYKRRKEKEREGEREGGRESKVAICLSPSFTCTETRKKREGKGIKFPFCFFFLKK